MRPRPRKGELGKEISSPQPPGHGTVHWTRPSVAGTEPEPLCFAAILVIPKGPRTQIIGLQAPTSIDTITKIPIVCVLGPLGYLR